MVILQKWGVLVLKRYKSGVCVHFSLVNSRDKKRFSQGCSHLLQAAACRSGAGCPDTRLHERSYPSTLVRAMVPPTHPLWIWGLHQSARCFSKSWFGSVSSTTYFENKTTPLFSLATCDIRRRQTVNLLWRPMPFRFLLSFLFFILFSSF